MRIKKVTLRRRLRGDFLRLWEGMAAGERAGAQPPPPPAGGRWEACRRHALGGGAAGLRPGSRTLQRAAQRKPPRTTAARGELLCRDQSVMGVKTLSLLVSATMSER